MATMTSDSLRERVARAIIRGHLEHHYPGYTEESLQNMQESRWPNYLPDADAALAVVAEWMVENESVNYEACKAWRDQMTVLEYAEFVGFSFEKHERCMRKALAAVARKMGEKA